MSNTVIKVEGLSKRYRIGAKEEGYKTFREAIMDGFTAPIKNLRRLRKLTEFDDNPIKKSDSIPNVHPAEPEGHSTGVSDETIWALKDVSFEVKRGEVIGIIGRNGAGKTTLLKILSRITEPTTGDVKLYGRVASLLEVGTGFHPELTGRENIYLNGAILGMRKEEINRKFDEIVDFAEIEKFLDTPVKRYSSGMYMRLAFAVAAHLEPEILLVDEVLAVGDAAFQKKCLGKMEDIAQHGRTVLFVSHNMAAIIGLCPRVLLITEGKIKCDGTSQNVVRSYIEEYKAKTSTVSLRKRQDRRGNSSIRMIDIRFGTQENHKSGFLITGKDVFIQVSYQCLPDQTYRNIEIALGVMKEDQTPLLYIGTKVVKQDIDFVCGVGISICQIKRLPLEPGRYSINTEIKQNGIIVDYVQAATTVDVLEGDYYGTGVIWPYGGLLCDYLWSHKKGDLNAADR